MSLLRCVILCLAAQSSDQHPAWQVEEADEGRACKTEEGQQEATSKVISSVLNKLINNRLVFAVVIYCHYTANSRSG